MSIRREQPILERGPAGPWRARVRVVPVTGIAGARSSLTAADTLFDVVAEWTGPPLPGLPPSHVPVDAQESYMLEDQELARAVARAAFDILRDGAELPFLRPIADAIKSAGVVGWRGPYRRAVGDDGKAAAARLVTAD